MENRTKIIGSSVIMASLLLSSINVCNAFSESTPTIENNIYSKTVTLKYSEEDKYFNDLQEKISFENNEYKKTNIEKISDSEKNQIEVTKEKKLDKLLSTKNKTKIKELFDEEITYSKDGYEGKIKLKDIEVETVSQGNYEKIEKLDIDFKGYSQNELANIEKEIEKKGYKWNLINVDWKVETSKEIDGTLVPQTYCGVMHYQRIGVYANPVKYRATAIYEGTVTAIDPEATYKISYNLIEIKKEEPVEEKQEINVRTPILIGSVGLLALLFAIFSRKNCLVYKKMSDGNKKIGSLRLTEKNLLIDLDKFKNETNQYIIKLNKSIFEKVKGKKGIVKYSNIKKEIIFTADIIRVDF